MTRSGVSGDAKRIEDNKRSLQSWAAGVAEMVMAGEHELGGRVCHNRRYVAASADAMWLFLKNVLFTIFVPGTVAVFLPRVLVEPDLAFPAVWGAPQLAALPI